MSWSPMSPAFLSGHPTAAGPTTPTDDFESGDFAGGTAWLLDWNPFGQVDITQDSPIQGAYHMKVDKGGQVSRPVDLSGQSNLTWQFWAKFGGSGGNRKAYAEVSSDGTNYDIVYTWDKDSGIDYEFRNINLSPYTMSSQFWFRFRSDGGGGQTWTLYVDDLTVSG